MGYRHKKEGALSLLPFLIFIVIYLGAGIYFQIHGVEMAFYQFPSVTAMFIAVLSAFFMGDETLQVKFGIFSRGAGNENVMTMLMIYILAGAFSAVAAAMGGRDATVNLGISFVPAQYLTAGIFIISAFMGTATGTSMGTIAAIVPIAAGISVKSGISEALMVAACVGGAMFGDNLSMISDTTIAATRTQGCELKDKFKMNFRIALPAAVLTIFLLLVIGQPSAAADLQELDYSLLKVFPYIAVLGLALLGANVFLVLTAGIFLAGFIGMASAELTVITFAQNIWNGFMGMGEAFFLALFCGGISEMIAYYGGIEWLISKLRKMIKGNKSAQLGIAALVSLTDCATANNTVAIIISGGVAKDTFMKTIAEAADVKEENILGHDLFLYNREKGSVWGANEEYVSIGRLDDLQCAFSSLKGFLAGEKKEYIAVHCVLDNEEVGSGTKQGAASTFLYDVLVRANQALGQDYEDYLRYLANSFMVSADNAHAVHPNYTEKADPVNRPYLNEGIVIKHSANQKYCTDGVSAAMFKDLCNEAEVPFQTFTNRSDILGGSTLGNISNTKVALNAVDIGLPQLAMHSPYETVGVKDTEYLIKAATKLFC